LELTDKTVVVTGAARGLGRKTAAMVAAKGARLMLADLSPEALEETAKDCRDAGGEASCYEVDVSDEPSVERFFDKVREDFGGVDALVNNAGITRDGLLVKTRDGKVVDKMSVDNWNAVIDVDLRGVFLCAREAAVQMIEQETAGVIVNVSSISRTGNFGQTNYSAAKSGVAAMTVTWTKELARHGIRVAAIAPGFCDTQMVANMPEKVLKSVVDRVPLKRLGKPDEIGHSIVYLLENDYFTGRVLKVDGGLRI